MDEHLSDADAFTVRMEQDPLLRSTIVAVAAPDRAARRAPNFRRRLEPGAPPLAPPRRVHDRTWT